MGRGIKIFLIFAVVGIALAVLGSCLWRSGIIINLLSQNLGGFFGGAAISNPLEKMPEVNPLDKANPFSGGYKNPFE